jgi:hypothetical protein
MAFKLIESAQRRWRMVNAPHLVALVRAGATFVNGKLAIKGAGPGISVSLSVRAERPSVRIDEEPLSRQARL